MKPFQILGGCACCLMLATCGDETSGYVAHVSTTAYRELMISGEDAVSGNYDPSLEYASDGVGWMAYSAINAGEQGQVQTRVARSDDNGRTWTRVMDVNSTSAANVELPDGGTLTGNWWHEVPSLVHDPDDPGREWKLYWHRFITRLPHRDERDRNFAFGWIATRDAPSPAGPWSEETALIGAGPFPIAPFETAFKIGDFHPDFSSYIILTEPGSLYHDGALYLTLQAVRDPKLGQHEHDIIMISSRDHGRTWQAVGVILTAEAASKFEASWFTGSSMAIEDGRIFLIVTPEVAEAGLSAHRGTIILEFDDIERGALRRDANGDLVVIKRLYPHLSLGGQADYDTQNFNGGIVVPQFDLGNVPKAFRIFGTGDGILE